MSSTPSNDRLENAETHVGDGAHAADDIFAAAGVDDAAPRARRTRKKRPAAHRREKAVPSHSADAGEPNDRLREHAAEVIAATRERIVERPLQAVLIAAAAGAFAALLLGAGRR